MKEIIETISDELRRIASEAGSYMRAGGRLYLEIGFDQGEDLRGLMETCGFEQIEIVRDLAGLDRTVVGRRAEMSKE